MRKKERNSAIHSFCILFPYRLISLTFIIVCVRAWLLKDLLEFTVLWTELKNKTYLINYFISLSLISFTHKAESKSNWTKVTLYCTRWSPTFHSLRLHVECTSMRTWKHHLRYNKHNNYSSLTMHERVRDFGGWIACWSGLGRSSSPHSGPGSVAKRAPTLHGICGRNRPNKHDSRVFTVIYATGCLVGASRTPALWGYVCKVCWADGPHSHPYQDGLNFQTPLLFGRWTHIDKIPPWLWEHLVIFFALRNRRTVHSRYDNITVWSAEF